MLRIIKVSQKGWKAKLIQIFSGSDINHVLYDGENEYIGFDPEMQGFNREDFEHITGDKIVKYTKYNDFERDFTVSKSKFKYSNKHNTKVFLANLPLIGRLLKAIMLRWFPPDKYNTNCCGFICTLHNMPDEYYFRLPKDL